MSLKKYFQVLSILMLLTIPAGSMLLVSHIILFKTLVVLVLSLLITKAPLSLSGKNISFLLAPIAYMYTFYWGYAMSSSLLIESMFSYSLILGQTKILVRLTLANFKRVFKRTVSR